MIKQHKITLGSALLILAFQPNLCSATNGYFAHGYGARNKAMGGTGVAFPQDAMAAAVNPAGMAFLKDRLDLELELFNPNRDYTVSGAPTFAPGAFPLNPGNVESDTDLFPVPTLGWNYRLDDQQTIGLTIFGNGGMNTDYTGFKSATCPPGGTGTFCAGRTGVDLAQGFISPSYAHSFANGRFSLGIAPILAVQYFRARGLNSFAGFSSDAQHVSNTSRDYSVGGGVRIGGLAELTPGLRLGASYKSRIFMTPFSDYSGLFAEKGSFDIPESVNAGLSWDVTKSFTASFDFEHIRYSTIKSVGSPLFPNLMTAQLGSNNGAGFGWQDMNVYKFGGQWKQNNQLTWRGGFSYGEQPIRDSQVLFNILAPGVIDWHITSGLTYQLPKGDELTFAFMYAPSRTVSGANPLSPGQTIDLRMDQFSFQFGWSRQF